MFHFFHYHKYSQRFLNAKPPSCAHIVTFNCNFPFLVLCLEAILSRRSTKIVSLAQAGRAGRIILVMINYM